VPFWLHRQLQPSGHDVICENLIYCLCFGKISKRDLITCPQIIKTLGARRVTGCRLHIWGPTVVRWHVNHVGVWWHSTRCKCNDIQFGKGKSRPVPVVARSIRRRCAAALLLRLWVRIPLGECLSVCCECRVLSGRGLCDELITRLEESYRLWCVVVCDLEISRIRRP